MGGYALSTCQAAPFYVARLCLFQIPGYSVSLKQEDTNKGMWVCSFKNRRKYGYRLLVIARLKTVSRIEIKTVSDGKTNVLPLMNTVIHRLPF